MVQAAVMSFEGACHSDMRNVVRRNTVELGLTLSPQGRRKYDSRVENWSVSPNFPAASAWQMTLLSLSWVASVGRLNSEDNRFMCYCFNDSPEASVAKLRQRHSKQEEQTCEPPHWLYSALVTKHVAPTLWEFIQRSCRNEDPCHICCSQTLDWIPR